MGRVGRTPREKHEMVRYARLTFSHDDAAIDPAVGDELDGGVAGGIVVGVGGWGRDEVSVGWMRGRAVEVEDGGELISTCRGQRRRKRIAHPIKDGHLDGAEYKGQVAR